MSKELAVKLINGDELTIPLEPGVPLYVVGPNGSGKSALIQHAVTQLSAENVRRISAHRQTWLESAAIDITAQTRRQVDQQLVRQERNPDYRWKEWNPAARLSSVLFDLTAKDNEQARLVRRLLRSGETDEAHTITEAENSPFERINELMETAGLKVAIENSTGEQIMARHRDAVEPYDMAQLSDGERNAVILAANVLTIDPSTVILIDEPERHLHRSITEPLLSALFSERPDCPFVVSTHEIALPLASPESKVLILRSCSWNGNSAEAWDAKLLEGNTDLPEEIRRAILGSRRKILFVEGKPQGIDANIYGTLFPSVSVIPVGDCDQVIDAVTGLRNSAQLHDVEGFGLIDADNRSDDDLTELSHRGIYSLNCYSVESIYFCSDAIGAVAKRQADSLGENSDGLIGRAGEGALNALGKVGASRDAGRATL